MYINFPTHNTHYVVFIKEASILKIRILSLILMVILICTTGLNAAAVSGKGTEANPFRISTYEELLLLADFPDCYFELENDIEITEIWEPVAEFSGQLDGKGHTITISSISSSTNTGFIDTLSGSVTNLTINCNNIEEEGINVSTTSLVYYGLLAGLNSGTIDNCRLTGTATISIKGRGNYFGGFAGYSSGTISNVTSAVNLDLNAKIFSYGSVNIGGWLYAGAICSVNDGTIENAVSTGSVSLSSLGYDGYDNLYSALYYGGISYSNGSTIVKCVNKPSESLNSATGDSATNYYAGISYKNNGAISNCYSLCPYGSTIYTYAGISGDNTGEIAYCYAVGGRFGTTKYGITVNSDSGTMTNCYYDKTLLGDSSTNYGTPKSTLAMKMEATYSGWDFENTWAIDESEESPINDGYPFLRDVTGDADSLPITVTTAKAVEGNLVFDTKITDAADTNMLHIALYDSSNSLCGYIIIPNERALKDIFTVFADDGKAATAKVFVWNEANKITPAAKSETVQIVRE